MKRKYTVKLILLIVHVYICMIVLPIFAKGPSYSYNIDVIEKINKFTYIWLSGNSRKYTKDLADFRKIIKEAREDKDEQSFILGNLYLSMFNYNQKALPGTRLFLERKDICFHRIHLIYSMLNPGKFSFNIDLLKNNKKRLVDFDYLWIGNYYLLKGEVKSAKRYYFLGIQQTKELLKSFDIMMEVAELYGASRIKKNFITCLPYVRPEDAFFFLSRELELPGYVLKIANPGSFSVARVEKYLKNKSFPMFVPGDSAYLTMGDIFLLLHTYLIFKGNHEKINSYRGPDYVPDEYRKIVEYLLGMKIISPHIDGRVHIESPVSGFYFAKVFMEVKKRVLAEAGDY